MSVITPKKVFAICGSTRQHSSNHQLINIIAEIFNPAIEINLFRNIASLPHFNPDEDGETVTAEITHFRKQFELADGILLCTPEYAHGVPGSLKNALDWVVSSSSFSGKPTALITASTDGKYCHPALLETLKVIEAKDVAELQLIIPFIKSKINNNKITDEKTLQDVNSLMMEFIRRM